MKFSSQRNKVITFYFAVYWRLFVIKQMLKAHWHLKRSTSHQNVLQEISTPSKADFHQLHSLHRWTSFFSYKLSRHNACLLYSLTLLSIAPIQTQLRFGQTKSGDFHSWLEFEDQKLSTVKASEVSPFSRVDPQ